MPDSDIESYVNEIFSDNNSITLINNMRNNCCDGEFSTAEGIVGRGIVLLVSYGILVIVALFGNVLVCHVIFRRKRMRTVTNIFIANLAVSDLLLITLNVPLNIARALMNEWSFGDVLCNVMNMSLITSVYASTFTLTVIALDRQRVLLYPLRPRILKSGGLVVVAVIWIVSVILALPFGIFSGTREVNIYLENLLRCQANFPSETFEKCITIATILIQYVIPLTIIAITYGRIVRRIWERTDLGAVTEHQHACRSKHKKKSIKMLMIVVVVFALCWMPLNLYQLLSKIHPDSETFHPDSKAFFVCHWLAISSTCYNPFIYCWLNETFRSEVRTLFRCCCHSELVHPRDHVMSESVSQSDFISLQVKTRSSVGNRHRFLLLVSGTSSTSRGPPTSDTISTGGRLTAGASSPDRALDQAGCQDLLGRHEDSWKSLDGNY